jgi:uncharacterized membrane protein YkoI
MLKRVLYGSGAMGVLTAGYLLGSVSLGGAFAQTAPTATPAQSQTAPAAKEQAETGQPEANEQAESAALAGQAKITEAQANTTALGQFAGGTVTKTELDSENGKVIYTVHLTDSAGKKQEAKVDATTGTLLPAEAAEGPETRGTPGAPETGEIQD